MEARIASLRYDENRKDGQMDCLRASAAVNDFTVSKSLSVIK